MNSNFAKIVILVLWMSTSVDILIAQRPYALGSFPNDGATHIFCNTFIRVHIHFTGEGKELDINTLSSDNIRLFPENREYEPVNAQLEYDRNFQYLHLRPLEILKPQTNYIFEINAGLRDDRGNEFLEFRLRFRTNDCQQDIVASRGPEPEPEPELPKSLIKLVDVKAQLKGAKVWIDWATKPEVMQAYYEISHSVDRNKFTSLEELESRGDSEDVQNYSHQDPNPQFGLNYYSLTAYDIYGEISFTDTLTVFKEMVDIPETLLKEGDSLAIDIMVAPRTSMAFMLKDKNGKEIMRKATFLPSDKRTYSIPLENISPGSYRVLLMTPQSRVEKEIKVVEK